MLKFIERAEQLKIIDAGDEAIASVRAPGFRPYLPHFEAVRFDVLAWADTLDATVLDARERYTERAHQDDVFQDEFRDVDVLVRRFEAWFRILKSAARALKAAGHPDAEHLYEMFKLNDFDGGSAENVHGNAPGLLRNVVAVGDLTPLGLPATFVDDAKALLDAFRGSRWEAWSAHMDRRAATSELHDALDAIVKQLDTLAAYREFAMELCGKEIPGLSLAVLRSSLAPNPRPAEPAEPTGSAPGLTTPPPLGL